MLISLQRLAVFPAKANVALSELTVVIDRRHRREIDDRMAIPLLRRFRKSLPQTSTAPAAAASMAPDSRQFPEPRDALSVTGDRAARTGEYR